MIHVDTAVQHNGSPVSGTVKLNNNDRLLFGTTQLFVFPNPLQKGRGSEVATWEKAQEEIASRSGFDMQKNAHKSEAEMALQASSFGTRSDQIESSSSVH